MRKEEYCRGVDIQRLRLDDRHFCGRDGMQRCVLMVRGERSCTQEFTECPKILRTNTARVFPPSATPTSPIFFTKLVRALEGRRSISFCHCCKVSYVYDIAIISLYYAYIIPIVLCMDFGCLVLGCWRSGARDLVRSVC